MSTANQNPGYRRDKLRDRIGELVERVDSLAESARRSQCNDQDLIVKLDELKLHLQEVHDDALRLHAQDMKPTDAEVSDGLLLDSTLLTAQRLQIIGTMSLGIAHDLCNLLSPILMAIEPLRLKLKDEDSQSFLAVLKMSAEHGVALVRQIVSFVRGDEHSRQSVDAQALLTEAVTFARTVFPKSIEVDYFREDDLWTLGGNFSQLLQVLMNLCVNARDAMPNGGKLTVKGENLQLDGSRFGRRGRFVLMIVSDTGPGIPVDQVDRSFGLFATTKGAEASGIGLAIAERIVQKHGGFIEVNSGVGAGTEMRLYLPASESQIEVARAKAKPELLAGRGELILVVDDELTVLLATKRMLETFGYRVLTASSGNEALTVYQQKRNEIRLVLMDVMMPNENGLQTIANLRQVDSRVRVVVASGLDPQDELIEAVNDGLIEALLWKPLTTESLLHTLATVLSRAH